MPRQRAVYQKSTKGCNQCKDGHVKCYEQYPCQRCSRSGKPCSYERKAKVRKSPKPLRFQLDLVQLPPRFALPAFSGSGSDYQAFQFFLEETTPILDHEFATHSWIGSLLAVQTTDPMVHRACLAAGALHRALLDKRDAQGGIATASAEDHDGGSSQHASLLYIKALRKARQGIETGTASPVALKLTSVLLAICSSLQRHSQDTTTHLLGGLQLVKDGPDVSNTLEAEIDGVLSGNRFSSLLMSGFIDVSSLPYQHCLMSVPLPTQPTDLRGARALLHELLRSCMVFSYYERNGLFASPADQERIRSVIQASLSHYRTSVGNLRQKTPLKDDAGFALLDAQFELGQLKVHMLDGPNGLASRPGQKGLELIVSSIQRFLDLYIQPGKPVLQTFSFQTGVIPMLLYAATNNHDEDLQRTILALLRRVPEVEGIWNATAALEAVQSLSSIRSDG